jgi:glycosyltransferase involved in cell wall biosynthesis
MRILFYTFIDFGNFESGSSVRPQKMYAAFKELGLDIILLQTQQNKRRERRLAVAEMNQWLDENTVDFCYVESPSGVILNRCDRMLLKRIKKMGIRIAVFYRDAYFLLPKSARSSVNPLKNLSIDFLCRMDIILYNKIADIMYFPSVSMAQLFNFKIKDLLPPACNESNSIITSNGNHCIYVGGLSDQYGLVTLLAAFDLLNLNASPVYYLTIVCRKEEQHYIPDEYCKKNWISIHNVSGRDLHELYQSASIALFPKKRSKYNDFAIAVKLYEYMSNGLPIVTTNCIEVARVVSENNIGIVTEDNPEAFAKGIRDLLSDRERYLNIVENVRHAVTSGNLWIHRAKKVLIDMENLISAEVSKRT